VTAVAGFPWTRKSLDIPDDYNVKCVNGSIQIRDPRDPPKFVTLLTHDPWPADPLSALLRCPCDCCATPIRFTTEQCWNRVTGSTILAGSGSGRGRVGSWVNVTDPCLLAEKAFTSSTAHCRQNNLSIQSTDTRWPGRITESKASESGRVTGQRFRPGYFCGTESVELQSCRSCNHGLHIAVGLLICPLLEPTAETPYGYKMRRGD